MSKYLNRVRDLDTLRALVHAYERNAAKPESEPLAKEATVNLAEPDKVVVAQRKAS